jgi:branched-chain amino acid aminotransferase
VGEGTPGEVTRAVQALFEDALYGRAEQYREWLDPVEVAARIG